MGDEEDELELTPDEAFPGISPVKVKVLNPVTPPESSPKLETVALETLVVADDGENLDTQDVERDEGTSEPKEELCDDDDEEDKGRRSRFLSERPPAEATSSALSYNGSNAQPIRTLGTI